MSRDSGGSLLTRRSPRPNYRCFFGDPGRRSRRFSWISGSWLAWETSTPTRRYGARGSTPRVRRRRFPTTQSNGSTTRFGTSSPERSMRAEPAFAITGTRRESAGHFRRNLPSTAGRASHVRAVGDVSQKPTRSMAGRPCSAITVSREQSDRDDAAVATKKRLTASQTSEAQLAVMRATVCDGAEDRPGVYRMLSADGEVVY